MTNIYKDFLTTGSKLTAQSSNFTKADCKMYVHCIVNICHVYTHMYIVCNIYV